MPRNGADVYSKPAGTTAVANTTVESAKYNSTIDDIAADLNAARPITAGGTGATSASAARTALAVPGLAGANTFTGIQKWAKGADVASATALTLGDDGNYFDITGTTAITSIATKGVGTRVLLQFDAALTLTHNATDLILLGGLSVTTAAGDHAEFVEYATGDWRCVNYVRAADTTLDVASATTTDIGAGGRSNIRITGTTTITGLGTVAEGTLRFVRMAGALTLTHNGTSLILPGAANITTAANDCFIARSLGSGNWLVMFYQQAAAVITPWVAYTPTFVGFGTVTSVAVRSRRVGQNLEIMGTFTSGANTGVTATMTLGFSGTNGGLTVDSFLTSVLAVGVATISVTGVTSLYTLALGGDGVVKFGGQSGALAGNSPALGTSLASSTRYAITASIPIQGW